MKKDKLIALLQQIEGNPDILLWNGLVGDWMDIGSIVPHDLVKMSLPYYLDGCRLQDCIDRKDWNWQLPAEEVADLTKRWRRFQWEFNPYVTEEDIKEGKYERGKKAGACKHERVAEVYMKHNDLAGFVVPHLSIDHDGYMPSIGPFGGSSTTLHLCLTCGQVKNWTAITDEQITAAFKDEEEDDDYNPRGWKRPRTEDEPVNVQPDPQFAKTQQLLLERLVETFGDQWAENEEAKDLLVEFRTTGITPYVRVAASRLLSIVEGE